MPDSEYTQLEDVWMEPSCILGRTWVHLNELTVNPDTRLYFYCALELRFCIESLFFEMLLRQKQGDLTNGDLKTYRHLDFIQELKKVDTDFLSHTCGGRVTPEDLKRLIELYGRLGRYLHLPKDLVVQQCQQGWKEALEELVGDAFMYLSELTGYQYPGCR